MQRTTINKTMTKNLYEVLGVTQSASSDEIKKAYRTLSKEHHPDAGGDAERFNEINEAYTVLSDTNRRKRYDETGETNVVNNQERILEYMIRSIVEIITVTPM
ncbi:MAG: J domain-containing protein, partial [Candidatus Thorarchaeota archaeon]